MTGIELIAQERERQITYSGYTAEHDDKHDKGELASAACYFAWPIELGISHRQIVASDLYPWNWSEGHADREYKPRIRQLAIAGALIAAEIDRLQRLSAKQEANNADAL